MSAVLFDDTAVESLAETCYELDDQKLLEVMLNALGLLHEHAGDDPGVANTVTVAKCAFEAIMARWLPIDAVAAAFKEVVGDA